MLHAGGVGRHQEHRHALVGADVGVGHRHDDEERGRLGVGGEELPPVDDPLVAVLDRPGLEQRRVGAGVGLGHRVAGEALAVEQGLEIALLLLVGAVVGDDLGVARVGSLAAEDDRTPTASGPGSRSAAPASAGRSPGRPARDRGGWPTAPGAAPPPSAGRSPRGASPRAGRTAGAGTARSSGSTSSRTNCVDPVQLLLVLGIGLEVPRHGCALPR